MLDVENQSFVKGEHIEVWLCIQNETYREYENVKPNTMEDMEIWKKSPNFDSTEMFIAELDGNPVGAVNAYIDRGRSARVTKF